MSKALVLLTRKKKGFFKKYESLKVQPKKKKQEKVGAFLVRASTEHFLQEEKQKINTPKSWTTVKSAV